MILKELYDILYQAKDEGAFPGGTFAIVFKDKTYLGCFGDKALVPEIEKNTIDTLYDMASVSKVLSTNTCAMKLVEAGKIRLFDRVVDYIPEYKHQNVRIYDLMTHTSGMLAYLRNVTSLKNSSEVWQKIMELDLEYETGSKIVYSCLNYIILGKIVERVSGLSLDKFAKENVFKPLEMNSTTYNPSDKMRCAPTEERNDPLYRGILRGYVHDETAYLLDGISGNAGVFSCAEDMSHFIKMILNQGMYKNTQFLSPATIDLFYTPQVSEKHGVYNVEELRSIGWIVKGAASSAGELTSPETILHTGFTGTNVWIDRKNEVGFCLLTNRVHPSRNSGLHISYRAKIANFIIAHLDKLKEEI